MLHAEDGEVLELSRKWTELTGYSRDEIGTQFDWVRLAYPHRIAAAEARILAEFSHDGEIAAGEWEVRTKHGSIRVWDFYNVSLGRLPDGRKLQVSAAVDVSDRKGVRGRTQAARHGCLRRARRIRRYRRGRNGNDRGSGPRIQHPGDQSFGD